MARSPDTGELAVALQQSIGMYVRRVRTLQAAGDLTLPERLALSRLDRTGPTTSAELARQEQMTPQAMGSTVRQLEELGLIERSADPQDGRRAILSVTRTGRQVLRARHDVRTEALTRALSANFTPIELKHLMAATALLERLTHNI